MSKEGQYAYSLLSKGAQRWVARKGWSDLRPIQSAACISLLDEAPDTSLVISAATASGKALTDDTPILTTGGWMPIGEVSKGTMAYSRDGRSYPVVGVFPQGECEVYRLTLSDGRFIDCNLEHRWLVRDAHDAPTAHELVLTTKELMEAGVRGIADGDDIESFRFQIRQANPIVFGSDTDVAFPIPPYVLGFIIGDGASVSDETIMFNRVNHSQLMSLCDKIGNGARILSSNTIGVEPNADTDATPCRGLGELVDYPMGISSLYKIASVRQRKDFIDGFIDGRRPLRTSEDTIVIDSDDSTLLADLTDLCRSVGLVVKQDSPDALLIAGMRWLDDPAWVTIVDIRDMGTQASMTCITIDSPDHTYVAKDYVVTHNTEAAFLPALTMVQKQMERSQENYVYMLYVAPLKALINDQYRRLCEMANPAGIPVYIWHGDAPQGQKAELMKNHCGILMTTPESLESFMMNRGRWVGDYLTPIVTVVDEFHAFLGEGRGRQLLSLLDRVDMVNLQNGKAPAVRIGLSATLAKLEKVGRILSPRRPVAVIDGASNGQDDSKLAVACFTGFISESARGITTVPDFTTMAQTIVNDSGNHKTLTFAKSRKDVETISATINDVCQVNGIASQAFPHHGSLSKETREALEHRLVSTEKPTMAVATVTLELGIDIGDIYEVFQVGAPNSVASLRQRMGRSGRRGGERNMKCLATISKSERDMQEEITTVIAEIELMNEGLFEEPNVKRHDVSVLISETLSVLKQYGTAYPDELYALLCENGGFSDISEELFHAIIDDMEEQKLIMFSEDGTCLIAEVGEREINDWHFYATFQGEESFSVKAGNRTIGEITPPTTSISMLRDGGIFMLAGRYWKVEDIDERAKSIQVKQTRTKGEFLVPVSRSGGDVSGMVKKKRISLLVGKDATVNPDYVDEAGIKALNEARDWAKEHHLNGLGIHIFDMGAEGSESAAEVRARLMCGWFDDAIAVCNPPVDAATHDAIHKMLMSAGMEPDGLNHLPLYRLHECCEACLSHYTGDHLDAMSLMDDAMIGFVREKEKYNHYLSDETLKMAYADEVLDVAGALRWMGAFERFWNHPKRKQL